MVRKNHNPNTEEIQYLYRNSLLSVNEIARMFNLTKSSIVLIGKAGATTKVGRYNRSPVHKLLAKFPVVSDGDACWEWMGTRDKNGYGSFRASGKTYKAHRVSWSFYFGDVPDGLDVLHKCDNPKCVNPYHLFLGTDVENAHDRAVKGRAYKPVGELCVHAKLTNEKVLKLRAEYACGGITYSELGKKYCIDSGTASRIVNRKTWKHI
jgi:hypothetical protein